MKKKIKEIKKYITTSEFIELLKQQDPKGNAIVCFSNCGDIFLPINISADLKKPSHVLLWSPKIWIGLQHYER